MEGSHSPDLKRPSHIAGLSLNREFCLCTGSAGSVKDVGAHLRPEKTCQNLGYDLSLIMSSGPKPGPMQGHRNHGTHI